MLPPTEPDCQLVLVSAEGLADIMIVYSNESGLLAASVHRHMTAYDFKCEADTCTLYSLASGCLEERPSLHTLDNERHAAALEVECTACS